VFFPMKAIEFFALSISKLMVNTASLPPHLMHAYNERCLTHDAPQVLDRMINLASYKNVSAAICPPPLSHRHAALTLKQVGLPLRFPFYGRIVMATVTTVGFVSLSP